MSNVHNPNVPFLVLFTDNNLLCLGPAKQHVESEHTASVQHYPGGCRRVHLHGGEQPRRAGGAGHAVSLAGGSAW